MSSSSQTPVVRTPLEKTEVHTEPMPQTSPIDLAGHQIVQIRPVVRTFSSLPHGALKTGTTAITAVGPTASIISVNRPSANVTILPAGITRGAGTPGGSPSQPISTYQLARVSNIRPGGSQPASITVTPIHPGPNLGPNIRIGTPVNNGSWIQGTPFGSIRATVLGTNRTVRPDGKMIHIPQGVQQITQLQMVDTKGSIIKPQLTSTPIVNIRTGTPGTPVAAFAPITLRTANIHSLPIRPQTPNSNTTQVQKVNTPILLNTQKIPIGPNPRMSTVCLTLSNATTLSANNSSPVIAVASRPAVTSTLGAGTLASPLPITKISYPVSREGTPGGVTINQVNVDGTVVTSGQSASNASVVVATAPTGGVGSYGQSQSHHLVQVPISVNATNAMGLSLPTSSGAGSITSGFLVGEKGVSLIPAQARPIALDKAASSLIVTQNQPQQAPGQSATVIPLAHSFAHPISMTQTGAAGTTQIITPVGQAHLPSAILSSTTQTITVGGGSPAYMNISGHHPHAIPTHVISQPIMVPGSGSAGPIGSTNSTSVVSSVSVTITTLSSAVTHSSTVSTTSATMPTSTSVTSNTNSLSTTPVQSPNQKNTLSPRPSILRKREAGDSHNTPLRAQRNLALNFAVNNSSAGGSASVSVSVSAAAAAAAANKENAGGNLPCATSEKASSAAGLSILRKEFQPPNEESSWQSCSSNSSSGSTTISTTSETAEMQMQQQIQQESAGSLNRNLVDLNASLPGGSSSSSSFAASSTNVQNGIVRSASAAVQGRVHRNSYSGKAQNKDLERLKAKDKEDLVSPRKKPRKQQLTTSDLLDSSAPPEISFYHGKRFKKSEQYTVFDGYNKAEKAGEPPPSEPSFQVVSAELIRTKVAYIKKPQMSLLQFNQPTPKATRNNHFLRYSDVKPREERKPTVTDLANQKNIKQKILPWKLKHVLDGMHEVIDLDENVVCNFNELLDKLENATRNPGPSERHRDLNRILELLKGNIQRCKVIQDQMKESRSQGIRIMDHEKRVLAVIAKYVNKRPVKKRTLT